MSCAVGKPAWRQFASWGPFRLSAHCYSRKRSLVDLLSFCPQLFIYMFDMFAIPPRRAYCRMAQSSKLKGQAWKLTSFRSKAKMQETIKYKS